MTQKYIIFEEELADYERWAGRCGYTIQALVHGSNIRSRPAESEREKVLDRIWQYFLDNDCETHISPLSGQKYYWISGTFSVSGLMKLVEELRQGGEQ